MHIGHDGERLSAFLDDELDEREALAVTRHVATCGACDAELTELRHTRTALRGLPDVEVPLAFMVESVVLGPDDRGDGPSLLPLGAIVLVSVLLVTAFALGGDSGGVNPDVESRVGDHLETVGGGPVVVPVMLDAERR